MATVLVVVCRMVEEAAVNEFAPLPSRALPSSPAPARAPYRFLEFFTAQIRNPHARRAYARAAMEFFDWLETKGVDT
jgi:hypothetical protein